LGNLEEYPEIAQSQPRFNLSFDFLRRLARADFLCFTLAVVVDEHVPVTAFLTDFNAH
jgi:hypothetical protein